MELVHRPGFTAVGLRVEADWQRLWRKMPEAWRELHERAGEIRHRVTNVLMDISVSVDCGCYTQLIGVEVAHADDVPEGMSAVHVPAGTYLHARHTGSLPEIAETFRRMYEWGRKNGVWLDEFKIDSGYTADGSEPYHDLYVRVIGTG